MRRGCNLFYQLPMQAREVGKIERNPLIYFCFLFFVSVNEQQLYKLQGDSNGLPRDLRQYA